MKIVDKRLESKKCFSSLNPGDTFMENSEIYIKVDMSITRGGENFNAIRLGLLGTRVAFAPEELVTPVNCELHIID